MSRLIREERRSPSGWLFAHAGIGIEAEQRGKLERLARYVSRPAAAAQPLDFLARLAALVPPPRAHLTRYHGVSPPRARCAPRSPLRAEAAVPGAPDGAIEQLPEQPVCRHAAMTWMQRLKRVFAIEIERCRRCGGKLKVIASIEDPSLIERILARVQPAAVDEEASPFAARAPPKPRLI